MIKEKTWKIIANILWISSLIIIPSLFFIGDVCNLWDISGSCDVLLNIFSITFLAGLAVSVILTERNKKPNNKP